MSAQTNPVESGIAAADSPHGFWHRTSRGGHETGTEKGLQFFRCCFSPNVSKHIHRRPLQCCSSPGQPPIKQVKLKIVNVYLLFAAAESLLAIASSEPNTGPSGSISIGRRLTSSDGARPQASFSRATSDPHIVPHWHAVVDSERRTGPRRPHDRDQRWPAASRRA